MDKTRRILVVDDEEEVLVALGKLIESFGHEVEVARNGIEALDKLTPEIDLILLDTVMPEMDGLEVIRRIRKNPQYEDLPIITVTGYSTNKDRIMAADAGADDFIAKPLDVLEIKLRTAALLKRKEIQDALKLHKIELEETVRKRTMELRESEAQYKYLFENSPVGIVRFDNNGNTIDVNRQILAILDSPSIEATKKINVLEFPSLIEIGFSADFQICIDENREISSIKLYTSKWGKTTWLRYILLPIHNENDDLVGIQGIFEDFSERKLAEEALIVSEKRFRDIADLLPQTVFEMDMKGNLTYANRSAFESFGYTHEEFDKGINVIQAIAPEEHKRAMENIQRALSGNPGKDIEYTALRKDGSTFPVIIYTSTIISEEKPVGLRGIIVDITDRKQTEEALRVSEERFRQIVERSNDVFYRQNINTAEFEYVSPHVLDILGYKSDEMFNQSLDEQKELLHPDDLPNLLNFSKELIKADEKGKKHLEREFRIKCKSGEYIWIHGSYNLVRDDKGEPHLIVGSLQDITERKHAEDALRESEERFRNLMEFVPGVSIQGFDSKGTILYWNKASEEVYGYTAEEALGQNLGDLIIPDDVMPLYEKALELGKNIEISGEFAPSGEVELLHKDGHLVPVYSMHTAVKLECKDPIFFCIDVDLSDRKKKEEALRESEERYRMLVDNAFDAIYLLRGRSYEYVNPRFCEITGYSSMELTSPDFDYNVILTDETKEFIQLRYEARERGEDISNQYQVEILNKSGEVLHVEVSTVPIGQPGEVAVLGIMRDITQRKQAEEERRKLESRFQEAQKKESLSILAGGIAHDFNNLLVGILGNASLALMDLSPFSPAKESLEEIEKSAQRAADLTKQMLAYSGKGRFVIKDFDLSELVSEMTRLVKASISKKARLESHFDRELPGIKGDMTQIRQLAMNLIINASEALEDKEGVITIKTGVKKCSEDFLNGTYLDEELSPGDYVYLEVTDTGCGMNDETLGKIFDPFFTTKFTGRGLGLAASLGIVEGHKGTISISSSLGEGAAFIVYFPVSAPHLQSPIEKLKTEIISRGAGTILIVDDEPAVLSLGKRALERAGYTILTAVDGEDGIEVFRKNADKVSLILLDLTMPKLNGDEAIIELKKIKPDVKVILSSGYSEEAARERFADQGLAGFIHKPYKLMKLIEMVNEFLG
ncbi:MAG: PAS domain S-box protein [Candidatus Electryonea clarkiae]|nr:PAS domain S-box protein [Candidatus Electryonea clarkiae]MDP8288672.1 PAS domain S-box protein [Candidatus Electryonea clarkiae]